MKRIALLLLTLLSVGIATAQITKPVTEEKPANDSKYLVGAVQETDGKVYLTRTIEFPATITSAEALTRIDAWLTRCAQDKRMLHETRLPQPNDHELQHSFSLEVTFSQSFISHDFTEATFVLAVSVEHGQAVMNMSHIVYRYNEGGKVNRYPAEEMISDEYALNKRKDKLVFGYKKFRIKTIDLMDELAESLSAELK